MAKFTLLGALGLNTKAFQAGVKGAKKSTGSLGRAFGGLQGRIAALVGVSGLLMLTRSIIRLGSDMTNAAQRTGTLTREFGALRRMALDTGSSQETVERALRNVSQRTEEAAQGNQQYTQALNRLGISAEKIVELPVAQRFEAIAQAVSRAENETEAMAIASRLLGQRAGPELIQVLRQIGSEGLEPMVKQLEDANRLIGDEVAESIEKLGTDIGRVRERFVILGATILHRLAPTILKLTDFIDRNAKAITALIVGTVFFIGITKGARAAFGIYTGFVAALGVAKAVTTGATVALIKATTVLIAKIAILSGGFAAIAFAAGIAAFKALDFSEGIDEATKSLDTLEDETEDAIEALRQLAREMDEVDDSQLDDMPDTFRNVALNANEAKESIADLRKEVGTLITSEEHLREAISDANRARRQGFLDRAAQSINEQRLNLLRLEAKGEMEAADELRKKIKLMEDALQIATRHNLTLKEAAGLVQDIAREQEKYNDAKASGNSESAEELHIRRLELKLLKAKAAGEQKQVDILERQIRIKREALRIQQRHNISLEDAYAIATNIANQEERSRRTDGEQQVADMLGDVPHARQGEAIRRAANEIGREQGIRFERVAGADGETRFRRHVDGRPDRELFTEEEMKAAMSEALEEGETDELLQDIKEILKGKFVNE